MKAALQVISALLKDKGTLRPAYQAIKAIATQAVEDAITTFSNIKLITSTEGSEEQHAARQAMANLDAMVHLAGILKSLPEKEPADKAALAFLTHKLAQIRDFLMHGTFSTLRLTVMNNHRVSELHTIPTGKLEAYPWYLEFFPLPTETIALIMDQYHEIKQPSYRFRPDFVNLITRELQKDDELRNAIEQAFRAKDPQIAQAIGI